jgi:hypothetical protein
MISTDTSFTPTGTWPAATKLLVLSESGPTPLDTKTKQRVYRKLRAVFCATIDKIKRVKLTEKGLEAPHGAQTMIESYEERKERKSVVIALSVSESR